MSNDIFSRLNPGISDLAPYEPGKPIDMSLKNMGLVTSSSLHPMKILWVHHLKH